MAIITQTFYISTGAKNAMYTLRLHRTAAGMTFGNFDPDFYLCTLAATEEKAIAKATEYVEAFRQRVSESETFKIVFYPGVNHETFKRRGKLSVRDSIQIEQIEQGIFPFGAHSGERIDQAPERYVLYFADKITETTDNPVSAALIARCAGIALELGYIARRDAKRAEIAAQDQLSNHIGQVGSRIELEGQLYVSYIKTSEFNQFWINKVRVGDNIVVYIGSKSLGEKGATIKFRATIKKHDSYNNIKTTQISRPLIIS